MKILVYSAKDFEIPYLNKANHLHFDLKFTDKALNLQTAPLSRGYDCISVFTNDDVSAHVIRELQLFGVKYIAARSAGYDNIDIPEAESFGIRVANVPEYSPYAVAEHAAAMILTLNRKLILSNEQVHRHNFTLGNLIGGDLHGKTVGLIGTGKIGSVMANIMHGFGCHLLAYDIVQSPDLEKKCNLRYCSLEELCLRADIISVHTPLTSETRHLLNERLFASMKKGVMIVNTARGAVVNTEHLIKYLKSGVIGAYGMDVYENEKGIFFVDHSEKGIEDQMLKELLTMKNVLITPHQGFATYEALTNIAEKTFHNILAWTEGVTSDTELTHFSMLVSDGK